MKTTGFASPATEYEKPRIDFNTILRPRPNSEVEFRYKGHDMEWCHIQDGDLLIVDRMTKVHDGCIAIVIYDNEFLRRLVKKAKTKEGFYFYDSGRWLKLEEVFGVVIHIIHSTESRKA